MGQVLTFPSPAAANRPDQEIVALLEQLLERTRSGEIQSLVVVSAGINGQGECAMRIDPDHTIAVARMLRTAKRKIVGL